MENTTKKFAVEIITQEGKWPRAGIAYVNKNGSISLYLGDEIAIAGGQKLYLRPVSENETKPKAQPAMTKTAPKNAA